MEKFHQHAQIFGCSYEGCAKPTRTDYCDEHRTYCAGCGEEFTSSGLNADGMCLDCVRKAQAAEGDAESMYEPAFASTISGGR